MGGQIISPKKPLTTPGSTAGRPALSPTTEFTDLGALALEHYKKAKAFLHRGDWAGYGRELESLERVLKQMAGGGETKEKD